jgi:hypothetical protein
MKSSTHLSVHKDERVTPAVFNSVILPMLDTQTLANVSRCSSVFFKNIKQSKVWFDRLCMLGCNKEVMQIVYNSAIISDYKKLYRSVSLLEKEVLKNLKAWEFFCLSGEIPAIQHAIEAKESLTKQTVGTKNRNALHYSAISGSVAAMKFVIAVLEIDKNSTDSLGRNVLFYANLSHSEKSKEYARLLTAKTTRDKMNEFIHDIGDKISDIMPNMDGLVYAPVMIIR